MLPRVLRQSSNEHADDHFLSLIASLVAAVKTDGVNRVQFTGLCKQKSNEVLPTKATFIHPSIFNKYRPIYRPNKYRTIYRPNKYRPIYMPNKYRPIYNLYISSKN